MKKSKEKLYKSRKFYINKWTNIVLDKFGKEYVLNIKYSDPDFGDGEALSYTITPRKLNELSLFLEDEFLKISKHY